MTAAWMGSVAMVQLLLNFNADPVLQNSVRHLHNVNYFVVHTVYTLPLLQEGVIAVDLCRSKSCKIIMGLLTDAEHQPFERTVRVFKGGKHHTPQRVGPKRS